jgi:hypothetical protein
MPFYDLDNTDVDDLPEEMRPDPHCVWVWVVYAKDGQNPGMTEVCFEKSMAERVAEMKTPEMGIRRTRMWFDSGVAEKEVHAIPGSGYDQ